MRLRERETSTESGAKYRGLLEAAPDAMVVVDEDGQIVLLNLQAERQFEYHRDELLGQPVTNIIPEGFAERLVADARRSAADALAQQIGSGIELSGRRNDGTVFPIEIMRHGGSLSVESQFGRGSTFSFSLAGIEARS